LNAPGKHLEAKSDFRTSLKQRSGDIQLPPMMARIVMAFAKEHHRLAGK
jgi:hypothetical protein